MASFKRSLLLLFSCFFSSVLFSMKGEGTLESHSQETHEGDHTVHGLPESLSTLKQSIIPQSPLKTNLTSREVGQSEHEETPVLSTIDPANQPSGQRRSIYINSDVSIREFLKNPNPYAMTALMPSIESYLFSHPDAFETVLKYHTLSKIKPNQQESFYNIADTAAKIGLLTGENLYKALIAVSRSLRFTLEDQAVPDSNLTAFQGFVETILAKPDFLKSLPEVYLMSFDSALKDLFRGPAQNKDFIRLRPFLGPLIRKVNAELQARSL